MSRLTIFYVAGGLLLIAAYGLLDPQEFPFPKCPLRSLTGWLCPGCGSQRAIHQLLHGNLMASFQLNALFLPALVYAFSGCAIAFFMPAQWPVIRQQWFGIRAARIALVIILVFWIGRNLV